MKTVKCGSITTQKGEKRVFPCKNLVMLFPSFDKRYLVGECSKCKDRVVRVVA